jgi:hypothetical protein
MRKSETEKEKKVKLGGASMSINSCGLFITKDKLNIRAALIPAKVNRSITCKNEASKKK